MQTLACVRVPCALALARASMHTASGVRVASARAAASAPGCAGGESGDASRLVRPVLSSTHDEARRRVLSLYRACIRQAPYIGVSSTLLCHSHFRCLSTLSSYALHIIHGQVRTTGRGVIQGTEGCVQGSRIMVS